MAHYAIPYQIPGTRIGEIAAISNTRPPLPLNPLQRLAKRLESGFIKLARKATSISPHSSHNTFPHSSSPLAVLLTASILFSTLLAYAFHDFVFYFGLAPMATLLPPSVETQILPLPYFWNVLTWHFFDSLNLIKLSLTLPLVHRAVSLLEPVFGAPALIFHILLNLLLTSIFAFFARILQGDTVEPLYGTGCLAIILSVFASSQLSHHTELLQRYPTTLRVLALLSGMKKPDSSSPNGGVIRKAPYFTLLGLSLLHIVSPDVPELWLCFVQTAITWGYLRHVCTFPSGRQGDRTLKLEGMFPPSLKRASDFVQAVVVLVFDFIENKSFFNYSGYARLLWLIINDFK